MTRLHTARRRPKRRWSRAGMLGGMVFFTGVAMLLLSFLFAGIHGFSTTTDSHTASTSSVQGASALEQYLTPVVEQDPKPFSSLAHADRTWMLKTAVWFAAGQKKYPYTANNQQAVPAACVLSAYRTFFGKNAAPHFQTFTADGTTYTYQTDTQTYDVPVTARKDICTPHVTWVEQQGDQIVATVEYIPGIGWTESDSGTLVPPAPVKTMRYTLQKDGTAYVLVSIQRA